MSNLVAAKPIEVLLVEDNPGDVRLTLEAFRGTPVSSRLHVVRDGEEAMAFLRREGPFADAPRPDVILLDLNLPRKDGREVLAEVKADENLRRIPVVVLTSSGSDRDIANSYELHANAYVTKPGNLDDFIASLKSIADFWLPVVRLPRSAWEWA